jgi:hypothetical protein
MLTQGFAPRLPGVVAKLPLVAETPVDKLKGRGRKFTRRSARPTSANLPPSPLTSTDRRSPFAHELSVAFSLRSLCYCHWPKSRRFAESAPTLPPRLIVIVSVDQLAYEYLERFQGGIRRRRFL